MRDSIGLGKEQVKRAKRICTLILGRRCSRVSRRLNAHLDLPIVLLGQNSHAPIELNRSAK